MPLQVISASSLPAREAKGAVIPEIQEVLNALKGMKDGTAIKVSLSTQTESRLGKDRNGKERNPLVSFSSALKRTFKSNGLSYDAYHNNNEKIVIVTKKKETHATAKK